MGDFEQCKRHGLPADWCGPCSAALEERERIIALIEQTFTKQTRFRQGTLIALIKGENE